MRVVTGEIPVRLLMFYPGSVAMTHLPQVGLLLSPRWRVAGNPPVSSVNLVKAALPGAQAAWGGYPVARPLVSHTLSRGGRAARVFGHYRRKDS